MRRPLVVLAAGFVLGEVLALQERVVWTAAAGCLVLAALLGTALAGAGEPHAGCRGRGVRNRAFLPFLYRKSLVWGLLLASAVAAGLGRGCQVRLRCDREAALARSLEGMGLSLEGTVGAVQEKEERWVLTLREAAVRAGRRRERFFAVLVYWEKEEGEERPEIGQRVTFSGRISAAERPTNLGVFDMSAYCRSKGAACSFFVEKRREVAGEGAPYFAALAEIRRWCRARIREMCRPEDASVYEAVLLGDTSSMPQELRELYRRNGISHLLAISGQHLTILGGGVYLLLRRAGLGYRKAGLTGGLLVVSYGILTGSSGSAMRAVVMILCLWLAAAEGKSYDTLSALGLAAILLLWQSPYLLTQGGFQLSFGAVLAIGGPGAWLERRLALTDARQKTILISLSVQLVITPVLLWQYYQYPVYGILLNLLTAPLVAALMYSGLLVIGLGGLCPPVGRLAALAGHLILSYYEWLCRWMTQLPAASLVMGRPGGRAILCYGGVAAALLWAVSRKKCRILSFGGKKGLAAVALAYILSFLFLLPAPVKGFEVLCLDVGQGDGFLLRAGRISVLIDGGSSSQKRLGEQVLEPCLKSLGVSRLDLAVVSHADADHISGLVYLLEKSADVQVDCLVLPAGGEGQEVYRELEELARERGGKTIYLRQGERLRAGEISLSCLMAKPPGEEDRNAHSLVLCADYREFHMLFTGDMGAKEEKELLREAQGKGETARFQREHLDHARILKVAHHGSAGSSSEEFLDRLDLRLAVVSYGKGNSYGHPAGEVLERLEERDIPLLETGRGGAVRLKTEGERLEAYYLYSGR